jgi:hypothetical protein
MPKCSDHPRGKTSSLEIAAPIRTHRPQVDLAIAHRERSRTIQTGNAAKAGVVPAVYENARFEGECAAAAALRSGISDACPGCPRRPGRSRRT